VLHYAEEVGEKYCLGKVRGCHYSEGKGYGKTIKEKERKNTGRRDEEGFKKTVTISESGDERASCDKSAAPQASKLTKRVRGSGR